MERITDEQLLAFAANELTGAERQSVEAWVATRPRAARTVALYRLAAARTAGDDTVAPPTPTLDRAKAIFRREPRPEAPGLADRLRELIARVVYDSRLQPATVRDVAAAERFELSFEADGAEVDLEAVRLPAADPRHAGRAGETRWRLTGQVAAIAEPGPVEVTLVPAGSGGPAVVSSSDDRALFTLDVAPGRYDLRLSLAQTVIVLPGIEVGSAP